MEFLLRIFEFLGGECGLLLRRLYVSLGGRGIVWEGSDLAFPLPFAVISEMLGMPDADSAQLREWWARSSAASSRWSTPS